MKKEKGRCDDCDGSECESCGGTTVDACDYKPNKLYYHEALDRSHVACDHFHEYVQKHPAVEHDAELKEAAEFVVSTMQGFYQLVGSKSWEFEKSNTP